MVQFDNKGGQIKIKVVYFGPALGGKTTCLRAIHQTLDPERRTTLYSLNTASDRTLFFDLLSLNLGQIRGYSLMTQLYTVPGQVQYSTTRKIVLAGADAVVFVADSDPARRDQNLQSLEDLWVNVEANGLERNTLPLVFQFNKRDLEHAVPLPEMEKALNSEGRPSFATVAVTGTGVMEAFSKVCEETLRSVAGRLGLGSNQAAVNRLIQQARKVLQPFVGQPDVDIESDGEFRVTASADETPDDEAVATERLVETAVRTNMEMTERSALLEDRNQQLERQIEVRTESLRQKLKELERAKRTGEEQAQDLEKRCEELRRSQALLGQIIVRIASQGMVETGGSRASEVARRAADLFPLLAVDTPLARSKEAVRGLITGAVSHLNEKAAVAGVDVLVSVPDDIGEVVCDGAAISKALAVVVENAVQFNRRGGRVTIEVLKMTRDGAPWTVFRVADTGVGVAKSDIDQVFEPFWRSQLAGENNPVGLGLGLTAARMVLLRHGGTMTLSSRIGKGTEVMLGLPERHRRQGGRPVVADAEP